MATITNGAELEAKMKKRLLEMGKLARAFGDAEIGNRGEGYNFVYSRTLFDRVTNRKVCKIDLDTIAKEYRLCDPSACGPNLRKLVEAYREGMEEAMTAMGLVAYEDPELFGIQIGYPKKEKTAA